jgi:malate dehydrogenase (oxaloacetate-decarboxylating)
MPTTRLKKKWRKSPIKNQASGTLADAMKHADIFIGVSAPNSVTQEMVRSMNADPMIFAMANPTPEIMPDDAKAAGAKIVGTGRSDFPNQINNVLVFPGLFRGALDVRAKAITEEMKMAAAKALAALISDEELKPDYVIPDAFDKRVAPTIAKAVADEAIRSGITK